MFILGFFKTIFTGIMCFITFIVIVCMSIFSTGNSPKDKIINIYDSIIQSFNNVGLTNNSELKGKRNFGKDKYVGTYKAEYDKYTGEETIFGGTALHRENGDHLKLTIKVQKQSGTIKVISKLGNNEITLIEDTGEYEDTIYIDGMSYYLTINLDNFTGSIDVISE